MEKIVVSKNKTLKLTNVIIKEIDFNNNNFDLENEIIRMDNYLINKGGEPLGPLIQYIELDDRGKTENQLSYKILRQSKNLVQDIDAPYIMRSIIKVKDCMYAHFVGNEEDIRYAHAKIELKAYEEEIKLKKNSFTILVSEESGIIVADIFVECEK